MRNILALLLLSTFSLAFSLDYLTLPDDELVMLAEEGDPEAQYNLGLLLESLKYSNDNLTLNYIERDSFYWYQLAAANGNLPSVTKIALEYLNSYGYFKEKNIPKAIELLTQASEEDNQASIYLAIINYTGLGVEKNREVALEYLAKSQSKYLRVKPVTYLEKEFVEMIRELVRENNQYAQFILGDFYYYGKTSYYSQDYKKAYRVFKKSADQGNINATYMVGLMNYDGTGVLKDLREAYKWISIAAEANLIPAIEKAALMNYFGDGTEVDFDKAFNLFTITAEAGNSLSQYFIGVMYFNGEGTEASRDSSREWIKAAYENGSVTAKKFWELKELWK